MTGDVKLLQRIADLKNELALCEAMYEDYCVKKMRVDNMRTDAAYDQFCARHPELDVSQRRFARIICELLGLKSKQAWLDGKRGSFYEYR